VPLLPNSQPFAGAAALGWGTPKRRETMKGFRATFSPAQLLAAVC